MRTVIVTLTTAILVAAICGIAFIYSGAYDIGADQPHWGLTYQVFETARVRSIKAHAAGITSPGSLDDQAKIVIGTEHFADHCAVCHGAPGVPKGEIAEGLYPQPPDLAVTSKRYTDAELFWIVRHGIKMTGMPSWSDHSDAELWATVAFLKKLPGITPEDYAKLVMQVGSHSGHHDGQEAPPGPTPLPTGKDQNQPTGKDHDHPAGHHH
jgi:mono/diheme cytochrome c family protein